MKCRAAVALLLLAGCAWSPPPSDALDSLDDLREPTTSSAPRGVPSSSPPTSPSQAECEDKALAAASYRPPDEVPIPDELPAGSFRYAD